MRTWDIFFYNILFSYLEYLNLWTTYIHHQQSSLVGPNGKPYRGNLDKVLTGALNSTTVFFHENDGRWSCNIKEGEALIKQTVDKFVRIESKRKRIGYTATHVSLKHTTTPNNIIKDKELYILDKLRSIVKRHLHNNTNRDINNNPLASLNGSENPQDLHSFLGDAKYMTLLQVFYIYIYNCK